MSIVDRIRELFGRKQSGAEVGATAATMGGAAAVASHDEPGTEVDQSDPGGTGGGESGGGGD